MNTSKVGLTVVKRMPAPFSPTWLRGLATVALTAVGYKTPVEIGIVFTGNGEIRKLNRHYRGKDCPTDVLSFNAEEGSGDLGDLVISIPFARAQATSGGRALRREIANLVIHGTLHLLGYDHMKKSEAKDMFSLQDEAMRRAGYESIDDNRWICST